MNTVAVIFAIELSCMGEFNNPRLSGVLYEQLHFIFRHKNPVTGTFEVDNLAVVSKVFMSLLLTLLTDV